MSESSVKLRFLACDSMGVRSFSFIVDMDGYILHVDPGASLAPRRYGLPPHSIEYKELEKSLDRIRKNLSEADAVFISHYHFDHYLRGDDAVLYKGKKLFIKDPKHNINYSQRKRSYVLLKYDNVEEIVARIHIADGNTYMLENGARIEFSSPVWHGEKGTKLGYVVMMKLEYEGYTIAYTSDVQGPMEDETLKILYRWKPNTLIVGGPPLYLAGYKTRRESIQAGLEHISEIARWPWVKELIVDHHLLRSQDYREALPRKGVSPTTCAEHEGMQPNLLEARRKELWGHQ